MFNKTAFLDMVFARFLSRPIAELLSRLCWSLLVYEVCNEYSECIPHSFHYCICGWNSGYIHVLFDKASACVTKILSCDH